MYLNRFITNVFRKCQISIYLFYSFTVKHCAFLYVARAILINVSLNFDEIIIINLCFFLFYIFPQDSDGNGYFRLLFVYFENSKYTSQDFEVEMVNPKNIHSRFFFPFKTSQFFPQNSQTICFEFRVYLFIFDITCIIYTPI